MGRRRDILVNIKNFLDGISIGGASLVAVNNYFDPMDNELELPKVAVIPAGETIIVGLFGEKKDRTMRVDIMGYAVVDDDNDIFLDGEDVVEAIIARLTSNEVASQLCGLGFSITDIGPLYAEKSDLRENLAFISIPLNVIFLDDVVL